MIHTLTTKQGIHRMHSLCSIKATDRGDSDRVGAAPLEFFCTHVRRPKGIGNSHDIGQRIISTSMAVHALSLDSLRFVSIRYCFVLLEYWTTTLSLSIMASRQPPVTLEPVASLKGDAVNICGQVLKLRCPRNRNPTIAWIPCERDRCRIHSSAGYTA
jgi:hypothetical protein